MSIVIRESITETFGFEPICINSALVSAQNRQRLYWVGKRNTDGTYSKVNVEQPEDKGLIVRDILDYPIILPGKHTKAKNTLRVGSLPRPNGELSTSQAFRIYSVEGKSVNITSGGGGAGAKTGLYAVPVKEDNVLSDEYWHGGFDGPLVGMVETPMTGRNGKQPSQHCRVYSCEDKSMCLGTDSRNRIIAPYDGKTEPCYEVKNEIITIKGKQYPIKLSDGFYIIRKLTVTECKRLQTVPEWFEFNVSDAQAYKMLGNGWTVDVISHLITATQEDRLCEEGRLNVQLLRLA
jgi:DNA (cytosine-5)-methyltransferase 3A